MLELDFINQGKKVEDKRKKSEIRSVKVLFQ